MRAVANTPKLALVHQGGGAKGAFGAGALRELHERGYRFDYQNYGVSVGALNTAAYRVGGPDLLDEVWLEVVTEAKIFKKYDTMQMAWRVLRGKDSLYDFSPLAKLLRETLGDGPYPGTYAGLVDLPSGNYYSMQANWETVFASASMPIFAAPYHGWTDGGVRNVTPLADAIDCGADAIVVVLCSPRGYKEVPEPKGVKAIGLRALDLAMNEIASNDILLVQRVNDLVMLAEKAGVELPPSPSGKPYRYVPITVIEPPQPLGETLDFSRDTLKYRYERGRAVVRSLMAHGRGQLFETERSITA